MGDIGCSCGGCEAHLMAVRRTFDGKEVQLWSDGVVTWGMGYGIEGIGRARSCSGRRLDVRAAWTVAAKVELYDAVEVPALVRLARRETRRGSGAAG